MRSQYDAKHSTPSLSASPYPCLPTPANQDTEPELTDVNDFLVRGKVQLEIFLKLHSRVVNATLSPQNDSRTPFS